MQHMNPGISKAGFGMDGIVWNILGQIYLPKQLNENSFAWHAVFPGGTFLPAHVHTTQDKFIHVLNGQINVLLDNRNYIAAAGDVVRVPMNLPHAILNKSEQAVTCLFWVTPSRKLYDLFWAIHGMKEQNPTDVAALATSYEVNFLPPAE